MHVVAGSSRRLMVLALALASGNLVLWYTAPWLRDCFDALNGRLVSPYRPMALSGVQELLVYFDPWLARYVFPLVYTLGFVMVAFLFHPAPDFAGTDFGSAILVIFLLAFEMVWVFLIVFAILCRGPDWNFYWPWEAWMPKLVPLNPINFSNVFWRYLTNLPIPNTSWIVREAPGLLLLTGYFSIGLLSARTLSRGVGYSTAACGFFFLMLFAFTPLFLRTLLAPQVADIDVRMLIVLLMASLVFAASCLFFRLMKAWCRFRGTSRPMAYWRCVLLVLLVQVAALVPLKVLLYWIFDLKYFLHFPNNLGNV